MPSRGLSEAKPTRRKKQKSKITKPISEIPTCMIQVLILNDSFNFSISFTLRQITLLYIYVLKHLASSRILKLKSIKNINLIKWFYPAAALELRMQFLNWTIFLLLINWLMGIWESNCLSASLQHSKLFLKLISEFRMSWIPEVEKRTFSSCLF